MEFYTSTLLTFDLWLLGTMNHSHDRSGRNVNPTTRWRTHHRMMILGLNTLLWWRTTPFLYNDEYTYKLPLIFWICKLCAYTCVCWALLLPQPSRACWPAVMACQKLLVMGPQMFSSASCLLASPSACFFFGFVVLESSDLECRLNYGYEVSQLFRR